MLGLYCFDDFQCCIYHCVHNWMNVCLVFTTYLQHKLLFIKFISVWVSVGFCFDIAFLLALFVCVCVCVLCFCVLQITVLCYVVLFRHCKWWIFSPNSIVLFVAINYNHVQFAANSYQQQNKLWIYSYNKYYVLGDCT